MLVEKTYRNRGLPVRILGIILVFWERFIYLKIQGIKGIPGLMKSPDRYTLITRYMGGDNLRDTKMPPGKEYFDDLTRLIREMHASGVVHLDLRNRRNYGMDDAGNPYLVDFASSIYLPFPKSLKNLLSIIDWMGFAKVKKKLAPDLLTPREKKLLDLGNTLSSWWLPTKAVRLIRELVKTLRG
ncbi:MAG TPA: hypothetical protein ENN05_02200 [Deltaproteobacteria bacterium]|nr:hypothetical protein [Deltaproteobacteria bacterium]